MLDPYSLGYKLGSALVDFIVRSSGTGVTITGYATIKTIAKAHKLVDKSAEAITQNLFNCLEFID